MTRIRILIAVAGFLFSGPGMAEGQLGRLGDLVRDAADAVQSANQEEITGTWEILLDAGGRAGTPEVLTLQDGGNGTLTGAFIVESLRSEESISGGRVDGERFSFARDGIQATYEGTFDGDEFRGTMTQPSGNRVLTYAFTGTRTSSDVISFAAPPEAAPPPAQGNDPDPVAQTPVQDVSQDPAPSSASSAVAAQPPTPTAGASGDPSVCFSFTCTGQGVLTIDGAPSSFSVDQCRIQPTRVGQTWTVTASTDAGPLQIGLQSGPSQNFANIGTQTGRYEATYFRQNAGWIRQYRDAQMQLITLPVDGPLTTDDGLNLTARGTLIEQDRGSEHEVQLELSCVPPAGTAGGGSGAPGTQPTSNPTPAAGPGAPGSAQQGSPVSDPAGQPNDVTLIVDGVPQSIPFEGCTAMGGPTE